MEIRISFKQDLKKILEVHAAAFGGRKGEEIAQFVNRPYSFTTAIPHCN